VSEDDLIAELCDMHWRHSARSGRAPSGEAWLHAMQRTHSRSAEHYYQTLLAGGDESWNMRSVHMADTVDMLARELGSADEPARIVVWAHDSHVGDGRGQAVGRSTLGQHLRERHGDDVALIGMTTFEGSVFVAPEWDEPGNEERLPASHPSSWEALFHELGLPRFMITASALRRASGEEIVRPHRCVGSVLRSDPYTDTRLSDFYDVIVHVDTSRAVEPLVEQASETRAMMEDDVRASAH
jgi:erythromycin esterase-like protein